MTDIRAPGEPPVFAAMPDLAARQMGGSVICASDDFFAGPENLIMARPPWFRGQDVRAQGAGV